MSYGGSHPLPAGWGGAVHRRQAPRLPFPLPGALYFSARARGAGSRLPASSRSRLVAPFAPGSRLSRFVCGARRSSAREKALRLGAGRLDLSAPALPLPLMGRGAWWGFYAGLSGYPIKAHRRRPSSATSRAIARRHCAASSVLTVASFVTGCSGAFPVARIMARAICCAHLSRSYFSRRVLSANSAPR